MCLIEEGFPAGAVGNEGVQCVHVFGQFQRLLVTLVSFEGIVIRGDFSLDPNEGFTVGLSTSTVPLNTWERESTR